MESFRIRNMKSFIDSGEIVIKPITIFVGKNSCGKSSLLRFPSVLAQTANTDTENPIRFYGKMVDYGNYEDVKHHGSLEKMSFELKYKTILNYTFDPHSRGRRLSEEERRPDIRDIVLRVTIDRYRKNIVVDKVELYSDGMLLYEIRRSANNKKYSFIVYYLYKDRYFYKLFNSFEIDSNKITFANFKPVYDYWDAVQELFTRNGIEENSIDPLVKTIFYRSTYNRYLIIDKEDFPEQFLPILDQWKQFTFYDNIVERVFNLYKSDFESLRYIGPFRENPSRIYRDPEYNSFSVGVHGENTSYELIRAYKSKDHILIDSISDWTKRVLGYEVTLKEVAAGMFTIMLKDENGVETNLIDNGYGISQVLPIVTEVIRLEIQSNKHNTRKGPKPGDFLLLEQPELHLHPAAQSELADLFVECALAKKGQNKILIETHSEHLIRKLQILVASEECLLTKDMVRIYYVDKDENGNSFVEEMTMLDNGKFEKPWPSGFFDKGYLLSKELARAGIRD